MTESQLVLMQHMGMGSIIFSSQDYKMSNKLSSKNAGFVHLHQLL